MVVQGNGSTTTDTTKKKEIYDYVPPHTACSQQKIKQNKLTCPCESTRLFSSRYVSINAPAKRYLSLVNCSFKNLPKRDELLFRNVLALPNDSRIGEESTTFCSRPKTPPTDRWVKKLTDHALRRTQKQKKAQYGGSIASVWGV